ncbi:uncharacterized protein LOC124285873 [Haliotis rubra]|uniref:uncharacterized protein LOC124285873 n=1 Tax=Haliotis rubra TaxID=36100 RepID=UPI001EE55826|nr:uncharacterized protein LOC124285873 [Haliotis rubra]
MANRKFYGAMVITILVTELLLAPFFYGLWLGGARRHFITSVVCDIGLFYMIRNIIERLYPVRHWKEGLRLAGYLTAFYSLNMCPSVAVFPHVFTCINAALQTTQTFVNISVIVLALIYVKK